ncbi:hypothetical protein DPEC_G00177290 [Dallia pectoralis]|uniref:Uncharacterized protein n=1 Tax=Dallia pectoralis TaxID=75939 RepID=A0ACC2GEU7_DALPE|nr:hypothetical protein DPEC_G00177290 [Dallia pectoralis]
MSPTEQHGPSQPCPDFRIKGQTNEKELLHILPQLQVKRAGFLTVILTGTLPQRRTFALPSENNVPELHGPQDDDVTKSDSNTESSQKSTEHSQDGAPDTLMAEDDGDPDLDDGCRTLVLFSPGDTRKSPSTGGEHALIVPVATPRDDRHVVGDSSMPQSLEQPVCLSFTMRSDLKPSTPVAPASPPFTKVEHTFVHIAETAHFNVMSSSSQTVNDCSNCGDLSAVTQKVSPQGDAPNLNGSVKKELQSPSREPEVSGWIPERFVISQKLDAHPTLVLVKPMETFAEVISPILEQRSCSGDYDKAPLSTNSVELPPSTHRLRIKSRIPVLLSEQTGDSERSALLSARALLRKRARQLDLARLVVQKQRGPWTRILSGTSSSLSSGDGKASETLSTAGSEEDTNATDESLVKRSSSLKARAAEEQGQRAWHSRIPRPVTPIKRPTRWLVASVPSPLTLPGSGMSAPASAINHVCQIPKIRLTTPPTQVQSTGSSSSSCPWPSAAPAQSRGSPRMPLRCVVGTRRSLSTSHCRTESPSPQRPHSIRQTLSLRPTTAAPPQPKTNSSTATRQSAKSQDPPNQVSTTMPARVRTKSTGPTKAKQSTRNKIAAAR